MLIVPEYNHYYTYNRHACMYMGLVELEEGH